MHQSEAGIERTQLVELSNYARQQIGGQSSSSKREIMTHFPCLNCLGKRRREKISQHQRVFEPFKKRFQLRSIIHQKEVVKKVSRNIITSKSIWTNTRKKGTTGVSQRRYLLVHEGLCQP